MAIIVKPRKRHKHLGSAGTQKQLLQSNWSCWRGWNLLCWSWGWKRGRGAKGSAQSTVHGNSCLCLCRQRHRHSRQAGEPLLILSLPSSCLPWPLASRPHQGSPNPKPLWLFHFSQIKLLVLELWIFLHIYIKIPKQSHYEILLEFW